MSKFVYVTDTHFRTQNPICRTDNILENLLEKWEWVCEFASENNAYILHGGDLFHTPNIPDYVAHKVIKICKKHKASIYFIIGNHDVSGGNCNKYDYSKIGIMAEYEWFTLVHGKAINFRDCIITGYDYSKKMECPELVDPIKDFNIENGKNLPVICMVHSMITDDTPIEVDGKRKTINWASMNVNADLLLSGHYHPGWKGIRTNPLAGTMVINPGAMIRQTAAESDMKRKPKVVLIDVVDKKLKVSFKTIPYKKKVFDKQLINGRIEALEERSKFIEALNSLNSEEVAGGNILKILDQINGMKMSDEVKQLISPKVLNRCRKRLMELMEQ